MPLRSIVNKIIGLIGIVACLPIIGAISLLWLPFFVESIAKSLAIANFSAVFFILILISSALSLLTFFYNEDDEIFGFSLHEIGLFLKLFFSLLIASQTLFFITTGIISYSIAGGAAILSLTAMSSVGVIIGFLKKDFLTQKVNSFLPLISTATFMANFLWWLFIVKATTTLILPVSIIFLAILWITNWAKLKESFYSYAFFGQLIGSVIILAIFSWPLIQISLMLPLSMLSPVVLLFVFSLYSFLSSDSDSFVNFLIWYGVVFLHLALFTLTAALLSILILVSPFVLLLYMAVIINTWPKAKKV